MNNDVEIQRLQLDGAVEIAKRMGLPLVATSDNTLRRSGGCRSTRHHAVDQYGSFPDRLVADKMENDQFFLRSPQQMYEKFPGLDDAVARSQDRRLGRHRPRIGQILFSRIRLPRSKDADRLSTAILCQRIDGSLSGDDERIADGELSEEVMARLDRELDVIEKLGYPTYFLIVWDFVKYARERGISATARAAAWGAIVCYALYLSDVCPLRYDLLFERFLDESRTEPPDIDIDFEKERLAQVIDYVKQRYGHEMVCQIGTFGTLAARAAIKNTRRAPGIPLARVNQVTEMVPDELKITIKKGLEMLT